MNNIVLIGFMGSGKTTVGKLLANELGAGFIDIDEKIVEQEGKTINEIFETQGEPAFRELETQYLEKLLTKKNKVISTGGGIILKEENVSLMKRIGTIIFLHSDEEQLIRHLEGDQNRPLLKADDYRARVKELLSQRESKYLNAADMIIQTTGNSIEKIVTEILTLL